MGLFCMCVEERGWVCVLCVCVCTHALHQPEAVEHIPLGMLEQGSPELQEEC